MRLLLFMFACVFGILLLMQWALPPPTPEERPLTHWQWCKKTGKPDCPSRHFIEFGYEEGQKPPR